jgi:uncharacterized cysteine cluster protein YcgN (CxxCxxCC family)
MDINGPASFYNFIKSIHLIDKDSSFVEISNCILDLGTCSCKSRDEKLSKLQHCNKLYIQLVNNIIPKLKYELLNKIPDRQISFYSDTGKLLMIISR